VIYFVSDLSYVDSVDVVSLRVWIYAGSYGVQCTNVALGGGGSSSGAMVAGIV
jgi:hypothetical protein